MARWPGRVPLLLLPTVALCWGGAGCATLGQWGIPGPMEPAAREERAVQNLRGQVTMEVVEAASEGEEKSLVFEGGLAIDSSRLRFQVFAPGGFLVADFLLERVGRGQLYLPGEQVLLAGFPHRLAALAPAVPFARFPPNLLWGTLLREHGSPGVEQDGVLVEYGGFREISGRRIPGRIAYHLPEKGFTLHLTFRTLEIDSPLTEDLFHLDLPPETEVREVR